MYKIFSEDGNTIAYTESVNYIRLHDNGCYTPATKDNAEGVAVDGAVYSLLGRDTLKGAVGTAGVAEFDGAALIAEQDAIVGELLAASLEG